MILYLKGEYEDFGVIIEGNVISYQYKTQSEIKMETLNIHKQKVVDAYLKYLQENNYLNILLYFSKADHKASLAAELAQSKRVHSSSKKKPRARKYEMLQRIIDEVLKCGNVVVPKSKSKKDLSLEDKLLILNNKEGNKRYVKDGMILYKKVLDKVYGDSTGEVGLSRNAVTQTMAIAAEDVHMLTISKKKFSTLFLQKLECLQTKKDFVKGILPTLNEDNLELMCTYLQEKVFENKECIYVSGEDAQAMYFVRIGKVQVIHFKQ